MGDCAAPEFEFLFSGLGRDSWTRILDPHQRRRTQNNVFNFRGERGGKDLFTKAFIRSVKCVSVRSHPFWSEHDKHNTKVTSLKYPAIFPVVCNSLGISVHGHKRAQRHARLQNTATNGPCEKLPLSWDQFCFQCWDHFCHTALRKRQNYARYIASALVQTNMEEQEQKSTERHTWKHQPSPLNLSLPYDKISKRLWILMRVPVSVQTTDTMYKYHRA